MFLRRSRVVLGFRKVDAGTVCRYDISCYDRDCQKIGREAEPVGAGNG
jgi:hypothetical protein